ncbi:MAG TPA: hypothetical protein VF077_08985 [Nitrospiraceae bacterium]
MKVGSDLPNTSEQTLAFVLGIAAGMIERLAGQEPPCDPTLTVCPRCQNKPVADCEMFAEPPSESQVVAAARHVVEVSAWDSDPQIDARRYRQEFPKAIAALASALQGQTVAPRKLTETERQTVAKLRYMAKQYSAGQYARGGGVHKHYLDEAADLIESLLSGQSVAAPA